MIFIFQSENGEQQVCLHHGLIRPLLKWRLTCETTVIALMTRY